MRMFLFGLISEIPFDLMVSGSFVYPFHQNVLWTFLISIGVLSLYEKIQTYKSVLARVVLMVLVTLGGYLLGFVGFVDYFGCGILMVVLFYFTRMDASMKWPHRAVLCFIQLVGMYWINCEMLKGMMIPVRIFGFTVEVHKQGIAILSLPLIWLYNGKQGVYNKIIKNVYYWFYPVHLLLLGILGAVS